MSRLRSRSTSSDSRASTTDTKGAGCAPISCWMAIGRKGMAGIGTVPTRRLPRAPLDTSVRSWAARRSSSKMAMARGAKLQSVHGGLDADGVWRSKSLTPSVLFQPGDGLGDGGLRQMQHRRRLAEAAVLEHRHEDAQLAHLQVAGQSLDQAVGRHVQCRKVDWIEGPEATVDAGRYGSL